MNTDFFRATLAMIAFLLLGYIFLDYLGMALCALYLLFGLVVTQGYCERHRVEMGLYLTVLKSVYWPKLLRRL